MARGQGNRPGPGLGGAPPDFLNKPQTGRGQALTEWPFIRDRGRAPTGLGPGGAPPDFRISSEGYAAGHSQNDVALYICQKLVLVINYFSLHGLLIN